MFQDEITAINFRPIDGQIHSLLPIQSEMCLFIIELQHSQLPTTACVDLSVLACYFILLMYIYFKCYHCNIQPIGLVYLAIKKITNF